MTGLEDLCAELCCGDDDRAEKAAVSLADYGQEALQAVRDLLKSQNADIRWWAIRTLAGFEVGCGALSDLMNALDDKSAEVRQAAAMAFCQNPDPLAVFLLGKALSDPDPMTARLASNALSLLGKQATSTLLNVLNNGSRAARLEAIRALAEIKDPDAIPDLLKALETDSAIIQYWAGLGLDNLGVGMLYLKPG